MSMALTPEGLRCGRKVVAAGTEADIYQALDLQYIEPELREGLDEIERAQAHSIPPLVTAEDLRGVLHAHTIASDGVDTLEAMNSRLFLDRGKVSAKLVGFAQGQRGCSSGIAKMPDRD